MSVFSGDRDRAVAAAGGHGQRSEPEPAACRWRASAGPCAAARHSPPAPGGGQALPDWEPLARPARSWVRLPGPSRDRLWGHCGRYMTGGVPRRCARASTRPRPTTRLHHEDFHPAGDILGAADHRLDRCRSRRLAAAVGGCAGPSVSERGRGVAWPFTHPGEPGCARSVPWRPARSCRPTTPSVSSRWRPGDPLGAAAFELRPDAMLVPGASNTPSSPVLRTSGHR